jgi:hypothetical protein
LALEENKELIKSFIEEIFNRHNLIAIDKYLVAKLLMAQEKHYNHSKSH